MRADEKKKLGERLISVREKAGIANTRAMAQSIEADPSYYAKAEKGEGLSDTYIDAIVSKYGVDKSWLLYGEITPNNETYVEKRRSRKNKAEDDLIPMYDRVVAQQGVVGHSLVPTKEIDKRGFVRTNMFKNAQFVIYASGNSMLPNYPPDAAIGIRKIEPRHISPGSVYVIDIGSDILLKRVYYKDDDQYSGVLMCLSDNTMLEEEISARKGKLKYPPQEVDMQDVIGIYKVTDTYKRNEIVVIT